MVRFVVKFKEWQLTIPVVTLAVAIVTFTVASYQGISNAVWCLLCVEILLVLIDAIITMYSLNVAVGLSTILTAIMFLAVTVSSPDSIVQYVCFVCHDVIILVLNILLIMQLVNWRIEMYNDEFCYRNIVGRKRYYKYCEVSNLEFFPNGYKIVVGNKRIRCYLHARNNDALYNELLKPNVPISKIKF